MKKLFLMLVLVFNLAGLAQAGQQAISVNFRNNGDVNGGGWGYHDSLFVTLHGVSVDDYQPIAGYVPVSGWNEPFQAANGVTYPLTDSAGAASGASMTVNRDFSYSWVLNVDSFYGPISDLDRNNARIFNSFIGHNANTGKKKLIEVTNIPYPRYTLYAILVNDADNRNSAITVGNTTFYYASVSNHTATLFPNPWTVATDTAEPATYRKATLAVFPGLSNPTLLIEFSCKGNSGISGFQIVDATTAYDPTPAHDAVDVPVNANLSWTAPSGFTPSAYTLNLSTDPNALAPFTAGTRTGTVFDPTNNLDFFTQYYWQVVATDPNNGAPVDFAGPVWTFRTAPALPVIDPATPTEALVKAGGSASFTASAANPSTGDETDLVYRWYKLNPDGDDLFLGEGKTLIIPNAALADEGAYYFTAVIGATGATADSSTARLNIKRLICDWKFDGNLIDSVGGFNGTATGIEPNYVEGMSGQAANFGAFGSPVTLPTDAWTSSGWTLSFWEKAAAGTGEWQSVIASGATDGYENLELNRHGADQYAHGVHGSYVWPTGNAPREQWQHVLVAYDGIANAWNWYLNGRLVAGATGAVSNGFDTVFYVGNVRAGGQQYIGAVDELRFYNYALDAFEAAAVYTELRPDDTICVTPVALDLNNDCKVDVEDLTLLLSGWMNCNLVPDCQ